jgi:hypothetical protein
VRALWYVLIGVVVAIGIESHDVVISEPDKALAESDAPIESKRIPVGDYTPSKKCAELCRVSVPEPLVRNKSLGPEQSEFCFDGDQ